jgi:hypothetical protein
VSPENLSTGKQDEYDGRTIYYFIHLYWGGDDEIMIDFNNEH